MIEPLSASKLLEIWEHGANCTPLERALIILNHVFPRVPTSRLGNLTIGQRDLCLLHLRELTFGSHINGLAECPACHERLELAFDASDLCAPGVSLPDLEMTDQLNTESSFQMEEFEVTFRQPTSDDLTSLAASTDSALVRGKLLEACVISVRQNGETATASDLPPAVQTAMIERMAEADPLTNLTLAATCPACGHAWQIIFDIASYFWSEINVWAARLMSEVHMLASTYGWREADILAMSAWRRGRYLELIGA